MDRKPKNMIKEQKQTKKLPKQVTQSRAKSKNKLILKQVQILIFMIKLKNP